MRSETTPLNRAREIVRGVGTAEFAAKCCVDRRELDRQLNSTGLHESMIRSIALTADRYKPAERFLLALADHLFPHAAGRTAAER